MRSASVLRSAMLAVPVLMVAAGWLLAAGSPTGGGDGSDTQRPRGLTEVSRTEGSEGQITLRVVEEDRGFDELRADYIGVLRTISDDEVGAANAIASLQREAYRKGSLGGLQRLERFQLSFAATLAARDRRCLPPIIWAHYESAGLQSGAEDRPVRAPALDVTANLATAMWRSARADEERAFAADAMVCSAFTLLTDGSRIQADRLFGQIIRLAPSSTLAWLGAAAIDERYGRFEDVVNLLSAADDGVIGAEGRLRFAVNLARTGDGDRSRQVLEALLADDPPTWARIVATEELARRHVEARDLEGAEVLLRAAIAELPAVSGLRVQFAWVLDQEGRSAAATRELEGISGVAADAVVAARFRYADWPQFDRAAVEAHLHEVATAAAPALTTVLAARGEGAAS